MVKHEPRKLVKKASTREMQEIVELASRLIDTADKRNQLTGKHVSEYTRKHKLQAQHIIDKYNKTHPNKAEQINLETFKSPASFIKAIDALRVHYGLSPLLKSKQAAALQQTKYRITDDKAQQELGKLVTSHKLKASITAEKDATFETLFGTLTLSELEAKQSDPVPGKFPIGPGDLTVSAKKHAHNRSTKRVTPETYVATVPTVTLEGLVSSFFSTDLHKSERTEDRYSAFLAFAATELNNSEATISRGMLKGLYNKFCNHEARNALYLDGIVIDPNNPDATIRKAEKTDYDRAQNIQNIFNTGDVDLDNVEFGPTGTLRRRSSSEEKGITDEIAAQMGRKLVDKFPNAISITAPASAQKQKADRNTPIKPYTESSRAAGKENIKARHNGIETAPGSHVDACKFAATQHHHRKRNHSAPVASVPAF